MAGRQIVVEFLGDSSNLKRAMGDVESRSSSLGSKLAKVGKVAAYGLGAGVAIAGKAMFDMTKGAIADEAAATKLANTLQNAAGATKGQVAATEDWITAQGKAYGVTDEELRPALARLVTATHDVGEAQKLASLAMDVSAGTGKSLESVSTALMKAENGRLDGLSRLGIATKNAAGETLTMDQAVKQMSATFGGSAAKQADTMQGKMQRLKVQLSEAGEAIGYKLIPMVSSMADWFANKALPAIEKLGGWVQQNLVPTLVKLGQVLLSVTRFLYKHKTAVAALATVLAALTVVVQLHAAAMAVAAAGGMAAWLRSTKLITAATKAWAAVQWVLNAALKANPIGIVITLLAALGVALVVAYKKSETFRNVVKGAMEAVKSPIDAVSNTVAWLVRQWNAVTVAVRAAASAMASVKAGAKTGFLSGLGNALPGMPHFAKGGVVTQPTIALIGEDGPEAVVPLGRKNAPRGSLAMGGEETIVVKLYLDSREIQQSLIKRKRTTGKALGLA